MFIAWRRGGLRGATGCAHRGGERQSLRASLVESVRKNGQPRHEVLAHFPQVRSCCLEDSPLTRVEWWESVRRLLQPLEEQIRMDVVVSQIEEKIRQPTKAEVRRAQAERSELHRHAGWSS